MNEKVSWGFLMSLSGFVAFFSNILLLIYVMIALVIFDFITKIMAILRNTKDKTIKQKLYKIKSYLAKFTPLKAFFYSLFIMLIYAMEIAIFKKSIYITNLLALLFYMTEIYSIAENLDFCFGNNIFVSSIKKIRKIFESKVTKVITDDKDNDIIN
jgi:hypothetical protein